MNLKQTATTAGTQNPRPLSRLRRAYLVSTLLAELLWNVPRLTRTFWKGVARIDRARNCKIKLQVRLVLADTEDAK